MCETFCPQSQYRRLLFTPHLSQQTGVVSGWFVNDYHGRDAQVESEEFLKAVRRDM